MWEEGDRYAHAYYMGQENVTGPRLNLSSLFTLVLYWIMLALSLVSFKL